MPSWCWVILFLSIGMLLLLLELITPGFGLTGISGLVLLGIGIWLSFKNLNLFWGLISTLASLTIVIIAIRLFPKSVIWRAMRLDLEISKKRGFVTSEDLEKFINKEGITLSILRPSGLALIEDRRLPVQSEGIFIPKGKEIVVTRTEGNTLIVREKGG